ncbi:ROK family protein [Sphingobacterium sp. HJSM2_6]|uniref:ROK family protein n=1 Tax=Sphingobacterium sp. HJSM2_6 TaxID=3366264 RepID=UPI003BCD7E06
MEKKYIGIEIGGTKLQLVIGDGKGNILQSIRFKINTTEGAEGIQSTIAQCLADWNHILPSITAIAVGFGGPVNWMDGTIQLSHQVDGWNQFDLKNWLQQLSGLPVFIENDANVAALGEAIHGAGKDKNRVFYMTIGSGIGGGFVLNQKIYHGKLPGEVEIGHIRLNKQGDTLESACSGWAINLRVRKYLEENEHSLLAKLSADQVGPESIWLGQALAQHDQDAQQLMMEIADDIAFALSHVVHLFHPEILIIGGGISLLGDYLLIPIQNQLPNYVMDALKPIPELKISTLGEEVVPIGALELAKNSL